MLLCAAAAPSLAACASVNAPRALPLAPPPRALVEKEPSALDAAVDAARVVCVGELHDQRPHHDFQRDVLERMASGGGPLLLGMEMFQRPVQQHLDDYVAGRIDELEMLRRTEYYTRWKFDHTMYAPLWRFCRDHGVRIVALNPDGPINSKVGRTGLASLTPEERAGVAAEVDLTDAEHRRRIMAVFENGAHQMPPERLAMLYEAMTTWDETMAESAARALGEAGPSSRMLIVAGSQHIQEFTGVAKRLARRVPGLEPLVVVCRVAGNDDDEGVAPSALGHFVVRTPENPLGEAPRLGIGIGADGAPRRVTQVAPGGIGAWIGLRAGDELESVAVRGGPRVAFRDATDLRWALAENHFSGTPMVLVWSRDGATTVKEFDVRAAAAMFPSGAPGMPPAAPAPAKP